eukprot:6013709-Alexandrium_andersonii.AAC.1
MSSHSDSDWSHSDEEISSWRDVVQFRPTLASQHPGATDVVASLPQHVRSRQAQLLGCEPTDLGLYLAMELPPISICREYVHYQNNYLATSWGEMDPMDSPHEVAR